MRVLFYARNTEQLGVEYIMSYLESKGHQVELLFDPGLDNNLYYRLDVLKFLNKWDKLIERAVNWKPDLVAFSAVTNIFPFALEFARRLKSCLDVPFVFGGIHATVLSDYVLQYDEIDYVIRGEGEYPLEELVSSLGNSEKISGINNLCYKKNGQIQINPLRSLIQNLDSLPFPKKDEFFRDRAFKNQLTLVTARGCFFKCTYCVNNYYQNRLYQVSSDARPKVRRRSVDNVIEEIKLCADKYPINNILIADEIFTIDKDWLRDFLKRFKQETENLTFSFCYHSSFINEEVVRMISQGGGRFAQGAIESADEELRKKVLKRFETNQDILKAIEMLRKYNIKISTSAIFGIPHETKESRWKTVEFIEKANVDMINTYLMYPFPGTEITEIALKDGYLSQENYKKTCQGFSSFHQYSLLDLPDGANAATMAKLLPFYIKGPKFLKPLIKRIMKSNMSGFAHFIYIATAPLFYSGWTRSWITNLFNMFFLSLSGKKQKSNRLPAG